MHGDAFPLCRLVQELLPLERPLELQSLRQFPSSDPSMGERKWTEGRGLPQSGKGASRSDHDESRGGVRRRILFSAGSEGIAHACPSPGFDP